MAASLRSGLRRLRSGYGRLAQAVNGCRHPVTRLASGRHATFFGYYDKTPFSGDDSRVLGLSLRGDSVGTADVGYFDLAAENRFTALGETTTWSWQLGARLQWMPGRENDLVGYNKLVEGRCGFVIQDTHSGKIEASYSHAVFDVSPDGHHAVGVNFARLHRLRAGYGYGACADATEGQLTPANDGIVLLDLHSGEQRLLLSLSELAAFEPQETMQGAEHYLNHVAFSPSGERFLVVHIWLRGGRSFSRHITCDIEARRPYVIESDVGLSHYFWKSESELLIHTATKPSGTRFNLYQDLVGLQKTIGRGVLSESGHPSYSPDGSRLVVDTYPDAVRLQRLLLCSADGALIEEVGRFHSPLAFSGGEKCDLHPRWDRSGRRLCIDSAHEGRRAMYVIELEADDGG